MKDKQKRTSDPTTKQYTLSSASPAQISYSDKVGESDSGSLFVQSTSPDTFLRRRKLLGADASTDKRQGGPVKSVGDLDTLYQKTERTTKPQEAEDPREPK